MQISEAKTEIRFFNSSSDFRRWLEINHQRAGDLTLGFYKKNSGKEGLSYADALDEALCFGWIDGVRKRLDDITYSIRFTPRKKTSVWSLVNLRHVDRLKKCGRMMPAGLHIQRTNENWPASLGRNRVRSTKNCPLQALIRSRIPPKAKVRTISLARKSWGNPSGTALASSSRRSCSG
jgi:hypothetical protein